MRNDEATVELGREALGRARQRRGGPGREDPTLDLLRPLSPREPTMELRDGDLEIVPPAPPPMRSSPAEELDLFGYFPLGTPVRELGDFDTGERGLRAFWRRLLFRLGWLRLDDGTPASL